MKYDFKKIEKKWQKKWEEGKVFDVKLDSKKKKYYVMEMFPYPSATGLHLGHALNYTIGDILARFKRMNNFNVLYPMGFDSLGLPAENAAIKAGEHPKKFTERAIKNYIKQMKNLGLSYDWSKMISSMEPEYYKWNQLFFLKFLEKGLAYRKKAAVNWCPKCDTVLANEQVVGGCCWRHEDTEVEIKHLEQWFLKTTDYAEELLDCIDGLGWPQKIKTMQKNWIGKSHGTEIDFEIEVGNSEGKISNVVIVHGGNEKDQEKIKKGYPQQNKRHFIPWIKEKVEGKNIPCFTPLMPENWSPKYEGWKKEFEKLEINEKSVLIGHSAGAAFLVRWLGDTKKKIKKLILVAPGINHVREWPTFKNFLDFQINKNVNTLAEEIILFSSDNDDKWIKESVEIFRKNLDVNFIELKGKGHFLEKQIGREFPELLDEILSNSNKKFPIFTTRPDTIYGVTFMVISAQHQRLMEFVTAEQKKEVEKFLTKIKSVSEKEMAKSGTPLGVHQGGASSSSSPQSTECWGKEGVFTGSYAINPVTKEKVPIWAGNFVVAEYGSGMVMGVPAHDQRDFEFAKKYGIDIKNVIQPTEGKYLVVEKSLSKEAVKKLNDFGDILVEQIDKSWGQFFRVNVSKGKEKEFIKFLENNLFSTSKDGGAWYADSMGTTNVSVFPKKHLYVKDEKTLEEYKKYGRKLGIPEEQLDIKLDVELFKEAYISSGKLINSEKFNSLDNETAKQEITKFLEKKKLGRKKVQFKMRDWLISRQRYWGTPIPIVYCDECGIVAIPEKDLPVKLPMNVKFGKGNPLATNKKFVNVKCPKCGGKARRETDTMDTFVDSSWYYMRYPDSHNDKVPFDKKIQEYWLPVDQYIGGIEHATMHLLYARFWTKALRDLGYISYGEPFTKLFNQGMLHGEDGEKMSKSKGNVILPEVVSEKYGIDTARFFLMSLASPDKARDWSDKGVEGSLKFINKIMDYFENVKICTQGCTPNNIQKNIVTKGIKNSSRIESKLNQTIKDVTKYIEEFKYNLAVIKLRDLFNSLPQETSKDVLEKSLKLLHPFCPHITEELWEKIGGKGFISLAEWPICDEKKIDESFEKQDELIRKLKVDIVHVKELTGKTGAQVYVYVLPNELEFYKDVKGVEIFSVSDKKKYDPENKSKKVKPNRPAIFLE